MKCEHEDAKEKIWLDTERKKDSQIAPDLDRLHNYCDLCGTVKNLTDKGKRLGYFANVLTGMRGKINFEARKKDSHLTKITDIQIRLIMKELEESDDFEDVYWQKLDVQKEMFIEILQKYVPGLPEEFISEFF